MMISSTHCINLATTISQSSRDKFRISRALALLRRDSTARIYLASWVMRNTNEPHSSNQSSIRNRETRKSARKMRSLLSLPRKSSTAINLTSSSRSDYRRASSQRLLRGSWNQEHFDSSSVRNRVRLQPRGY